MWWGLKETTVTPNNCQGNGFAHVTATTSPAKALITVVTLGIWIPMTVEWSCAKDRGSL